MATRRNQKFRYTRELVGERFVYLHGKRRLTRRSEIERLDALAIPPAWTDVEISRSVSAKVLAKGVDAAGRTQSIYHPAFRKRQDRRKFNRLLSFGRALPRLRASVDRDLRRHGLNRDRITACAVRVVDLLLFRVGNPEYAKRHRSYGVTTLRQEHLTMNSSTVEFEFVGKGGKRQHQRVRDPRVVRLIARLGEPPGSEVFRFVDEEGVVHSLRSRHVNAYVKKHMGEDFTVKDFRTWGGTVFVASALLEIEPSQLNSAQDRSTAVREAVSGAAQRLGNTPAVTRSSYIDPRVLEAVEHPKMLAKVRKARLRTSRYLNPGEQRTIRLLSEMTRSRKP